MSLWHRGHVHGDSVCPGCGAHVFANKVVAIGATFTKPVHFAGDAVIRDSSFSFKGSKQAEITAQKTFSICNSTFNTTAGVRLTGGGPFIAPDPVAPADLELTFGTEPIVGWRAWGIADFKFRGGATEKRLTPFASQMPWEPMTRMEAVCTAGGRHEAPWRGCTCGIWAVRDRETAATVGPDVIGSVYLWGRVLEFEHGYRAQYAYPQALMAPDQGTADDLARIYGVPAEVVA